MCMSSEIVGKLTNGTRGPPYGGRGGRGRATMHAINYGGIRRTYYTKNIQKDGSHDTVVSV